MTSSTVSAYDVYWEYQRLCDRFNERVRGFNLPFGLDRGHLGELRQRARDEKPPALPVPIGDPNCVVCGGNGEIPAHSIDVPPDGPTMLPCPGCKFEYNSRP